MILNVTFCYVTTVLLLLAGYCSSTRHVARKHVHHNVERVNLVPKTDPDAIEPPYMICIITGHIYCGGKPAAWLRPFLTSPEYPAQQISISVTHEDGRFKLSTTGYILLREPVQIEIRHVCPIPGVPFDDHCAVPYLTTSVTVDHRNKTDVYVDVNLEDHKMDTNSFCLL
ncbi:unnamed protein product [Caenorhabditis angaria]|uniref:MD-2-related lipid-recognition domain-containing protein n=1 Tax=Caenorhabditis angaria TaxID=860376 RepID=A0A9P1MYV8_9PELO|nr:unnamed protein product [Caenorhabditis angaria]